MLKVDKIDTIIWDLDQTLYKYWDGVPEAFSEYTGRSSSILARHHYMRDVNINEAVGLALQSYKDHGLTTTLPACRYDLDEVELYRHHHRLLIDEYVAPNWHRAGIEDDIKESFNALAAHGIRSLVLTHGTCEWGDAIATRLGIRDHFCQVRGIDSLRLKLKWRDKCLFDEFLDSCAVTPVSTGDYSNVLVVEDTPANLTIPKQAFNMQTALIRTDRVQPQLLEKYLIIDETTDNIRNLRNFILQ